MTLPQITSPDPFITPDGGLETSPIYLHGIDLPDAAAIAATITTLRGAA